jgi:hypothetical protein
MAELPQVIVNGIGLTGIDLSQGLSVSNVAGRVVVNGQELPASNADGLTVSGEATITNANTGAATSNGNGGVEVSGIVVGSVETAGPVMLNLANTGSADASNSLVVGAAPAMALDMLVMPAAVDHTPLGFYSLPDFGPDWLFG